MLTNSFSPVSNAASFDPQSRYDSTRELTLADILTTEEEADRDAANVLAVREWLAREGN